MSAAHTAMVYGQRAGLIHGLGLSLGLFVWGVLAGVGLGTLIIGFAPALVTLKIAGGLYLLWLAWKSGVQALKRGDVDVAAPNAKGHFRRGLLLNLANPKAIFAWLSVIAIGMPEAPDTGFVIVATLACGVLGAAIYSVLAIAFARPSVMSGYRRARAWVDGACAVFFAAAGLKLLASRTT